jgi:hypothetical protein
LLIFFNKLSRTFLERNVPKMSILDVGIKMGTKLCTQNKCNFYLQVHFFFTSRSHLSTFWLIKPKERRINPWPKSRMSEYQVLTKILKDN